MTMTQTRNTAVDTVNEATEHAKDAGDDVRRDDPFDRRSGS